MNTSIKRVKRANKSNFYSLQTAFSMRHCTTCAQWNGLCSQLNCNKVVVAWKQNIQLTASAGLRSAVTAAPREPGRGMELFIREKEQTEVSKPEDLCWFVTDSPSLPASSTWRKQQLLPVFITRRRPPLPPPPPPPSTEARTNHKYTSIQMPTLYLSAPLISDSNM